MSAEPKIYEYPSLAAFIRTFRMHHTPLSIRAASVAAGFPVGSWGPHESGHLVHPSLKKIHGIAHALGVRPWPLAIIAGISETPLHRLGSLVLDHALPTSSQVWWNQRGGAFLRCARGDQALTTVASRWAQKWPHIPMLANPQAWEILETTGILPPLPPPPPPLRSQIPPSPLRQVPGPWLWAVLDAATGDEVRAYYLLPGLALAMETANRDTAAACEDLTSWNVLADAFARCHAVKPAVETFDDLQYFTAAQTLADTMRLAAEHMTSEQRLAQMTAIWESLSKEQQEHLLGLAEELGTRHNPPPKGK